MKFYGASEHASMAIRDDPGIEIALRELQTEHPIDVVIETGTYLGTGSTRILAEFFGRNRPVRRFVTMEANWSYWKTARSNLRRFPFIEPKWGLSVNKQKAIEFIRSDPAIREHHRYPDIFIDDINDPVDFYIREVQGSGASHHATPNIHGLRPTLKQFVKRALYWQGEDLLARTLKRHRNDWPLIVLDSAGGIGQLEFQTTVETMGSANYALFLDDTYHLKHFRSLLAIQSRPDFRSIGMAKDKRWILAVHRSS
jgi:hypothetical protein